MTYFRRLALVFVVALSLVAAGGAREARAATIGVDAGWVTGTITAVADVLSFDFTLLTAGVFSLTDCCTAGDTWTIAGDIVGASALGLEPIAVPLGIGQNFASHDPAWLDAAFGHFQTVLAAGLYSIRVTGDGVGGLPAALGVRVDTYAAIPVPAAGLLLIGALGGLMALRRRTRS